MSKHSVLIVGGGFGGVKAALELAEDDRFDVTVLSDRANFQYYPTLYHTATGGLAAQSEIPLTTLFANKPIQLIIDKAVSIDKKAHTISTAGGKTLHYDDVIIGLGTVTNYFGIKGLPEYSYGIKSIEEIGRLKKHIHAQLTDKRKPDMHYIIVGGGPTGIELAGALPSYLHRIMKNHGVRDRSVHIDLVEAMPHLLPRLPKSTSRAVERRLKALGVTLHLGKTVQGETADSLIVGGKPIQSHTVIWTAGMANNPFYTDNHFSFGPRGKVGVNVYLQADDNVYVIGDSANTPYSGMAQTAVYDGGFVAKNLRRIQSGKDPKPYTPKKPISVVPAGPGWSAVQWGRLQFKGTSGFLLRQAADIRGFSDIEPLIPAAKQWFTEFGEEEDCDTCKRAMFA